MIKKYIEDIFIVSGLVFLSVAAFLLHYILGIAVVGLFFLVLGYYFARNPPSNSRGYAKHPPPSSIKKGGDGF